MADEAATTSPILHVEPSTFEKMRRVPRSRSVAGM
jgi:hypothetical protein